LLVECTPLWAARLAAHTPLPDRRLNNRLALLLETFADAPEASIPQACCGWAATQGAYRFLETPRVTDSHLLQGICRHTAEAALPHCTLLLVQDTTTLNLSQSPVAQLGPIDAHGKARGLFLHSTLAVDPDGEVLGPLGLLRWVRPQAGQPKPSDKESGKWLQGIDQAHAALAEVAAGRPLPRLVHIMDREGDCWDVLQWIDECGDSAILRCAQNRCVEEPLQRAHQAVRAQPVLFEHSLTIPARPGRPQRQASLEVRRLEVTLVPDREKYPHGWSMDWTLVEAWEAETPDAGEAVHWLLWTREETATVEQVREVLGGYTRRWCVEEYHLTLKSGCQVERLQLEEWDHLQNALVLYAAVAARVVQLRDRARQQPQQPAQEILSVEECAVLVGRFGRGRATVEGLTVGQAVLWIGRLGGHLNRKSDGMPGVRTLWKGLRALDLMVQGWRAAQQIMEHNIPQHKPLE
jgi:hypothetical protein